MTEVVCLLQSDPLQPVAHVEGIVSLVWERLTVFSDVMVGAVIIATFSPLWLWSLTRANAGSDLERLRYGVASHVPDAQVSRASGWIRPELCYRLVVGDHRPFGVRRSNR